MPRIASAVRAMRITLAAIARAEVQRAGLAEQPVDRARAASASSGRTMKRVAPNSPSEMANAKPGRDQRGAGDDRQVDLAPHPRGDAPSVAAASRRRGSMARSTGVITRTTNGTATSACAIGTSHHEPRRSSGGVVERDEEPEPDRDRRDAERERRRSVSSPRRARRRQRERRAAADDDRDHGGDRREARASWRWRRTGSHEQRAARVHLAERPVEVETEPVRRVERADDEHGDRHAEQHGHQREVGADERAGARGPRSARGLGRGAQRAA